MSGKTVVVQEDTLVPGWYGKIPSLGDFASRRLPQHFISTWDAWLQHSLAASRAILGTRWLDIYLTSPIWRFALLHGVVDQNAWAGLMMPSVDKVGRHFPLTLAVTLDARQHTPAAIVAAQSWYAKLEQVALATLNIDFPAERLEGELAALPFPANGGDPDDIAADQLAQWWQNPSSACWLALPGIDALPEFLSAAANRLLTQSSSGKSLWWTGMQDSSSAQLVCFAGLPPEERYADLLEGTRLPETTL